MSYLPTSSTSTINDNPRPNLVRQVLEQGQRLRAAMVQTLLSQEPMSVNLVCNSYNKKTSASIIGPPMHVINNTIEPINNITHTDRTKFLSYLRGDKMSLAEEQEALHTFRSMSNSDIYELTEHAKQSGDVCDCDTCKAYQNTIENNELKCDIVQCSHTNLEIAEETRHKCKCDYNLEGNPNLSCLKYADSIKVCMHSITLNKEGSKKLYSKSNKLNITYFVEYSIPCDLLKLPVKSRTKVNTGLDSDNMVRMCSKRIIDNAVYFKQISLHNVCNINDLDLCKIDLRFKVCSRVPNQKGINVLGFATFNMSSFRNTKNFTCSQELPILLKDNIPIVLGSIRVSLQLGCGKIYFGQEFIDALNNTLEINTLSETFFKEEESNKTVAVKASCKNLQIDHSISKDEVEPLIVEKLDLPTFVRDKPKLSRNTSRKHIITNEYDSRKCTALVKTDIKTPIAAKADKIAQNTVKQNKILFGFIYVSQAQYLESIGSSLLSCKPFGHEDIVVSRVIADTTNPVFNFQQRIPYVYGEVLLNNLRDNYMIIEFWEQIDSNRKLIGFSTISLHQFYLAFRNPDIVTYLDRNKLPVVGSDWWEPITDPDTKELRGQAQILVALGSQIQIDTLLVERGFTEYNVKRPKYETLKSHTGSRKVTCFKKTSSKIDVGVQSESNNMNDKIKENDNSTQSTQDMLGLILTQLIDQTSRNNQNNVSTVDNRICSTNDAVLSAEGKTDSSLQLQPKSTAELMDSVQTVLSIPPLIDNPSPQSLSTTFDAHIVIEKALHLPTRRKCKVKKSMRGKCTKSADEILMPSTYVTFETTPNGQPLMTHIVQKSASPVWNWNSNVKLPVNLLTNNQKRIIFKVWKKNNNAYMQPNMNLDTIIGFASLDLTVLLAGLPTIEGWFNIIDFSSKCHGQINIIIKPLESVSRFNKSSASATCTSTSCEPSPNGCVELMQMDQEPGEMLNRALKRKFTELDEITQRLRSRLSDVVTDTGCIDSESDVSNDGFSEQFDRDINTLSIEGDYGHVDFVQQAKLVQLQQVSQTLREMQSKEMVTRQGVLSIAANPSESTSCLLLATGEGTTQDTSTSSLRTDSSVKTVAQPATPILLKNLDQELVQGKQRIDNLLHKLTLMSNADTTRHVSGCSISDVEGSNTTLTDATELSSRALDAGQVRADNCTSTSSSEQNGQATSIKIFEQCRPLPDGEGSTTDS